eukprot:1503365-Rhodomonas_salina.1
MKKFTKKHCLRQRAREEADLTAPGAHVWSLSHLTWTTCPCGPTPSTTVTALSGGLWTSPAPVTTSAS